MYFALQFSKLFSIFTRISVFFRITNAFQAIPADMHWLIVEEGSDLPVKPQN